MINGKSGETMSSATFDQVSWSSAAPWMYSLSVAAPSTTRDAEIQTIGIYSNSKMKRKSKLDMSTMRKKRGGSERWKLGAQGSEWGLIRTARTGLGNFGASSKIVFAIGSL